jgi:prepilin-type N-terminal cleavage/methylation domain-containing protein
MKALKAFTIIELLVSMLLSAIVIALAYNVYHSTEDSYRTAYGQFGRTTDLLQLQSLLNHDCNNAKMVVFEDNIMKVERLDHNPVNYMVKGDKIIRQTGAVVDTFSLGILETTALYLFDKPPVLENLLIYVQISKNMEYTLSAQVFYTNKIKFAMSETEDSNN